MASPSFDPEKLYEALDRKRRRRHIKWRDVAAGASVSPSTLTRISQGKRPDADSLVRLMAWLGQFDIRQFTTGIEHAPIFGSLASGLVTGINVMPPPEPPPRIIVVRDPRELA